MRSTRLASPASPLRRLRRSPVFERAPREFHFVVACCRWPRSPELDLRLREQEAGLDWPLVARIAKRHRVEALAWSALKRAEILPPAAVAAALAQAADETARQNLQIAVESQRLRQMLERAGIPTLFMKGISLGALAYGTILLKAGWDIDILVPPDRIPAAAKLLRESGYTPVLPAITGDLAPIVEWHRGSKESVWRDAGRGLHVELHSALSDLPLIPGIGTDSPCQDVQVARGVSLTTLAGDELFAYLCVHGASSAWFRLKWLADLAALISGCDTAEIDRLYARSQAAGAGRAADLAVLLCHSLFKTAVDPALVARLRRDWVNRWLVASAKYSLTGRTLTTEILQVRFGTLGIHLSQFGLRPGLRYKRAVLRRELAPLRRYFPRLRAARGGG